jgi:carbon starvation protein
MQELFGKVYKPLSRSDWWPGAISTSLLVVAGWAYFISTGTISTIWPMFGIANQLLASIALCIGTTVIINSGKDRYAWVTILPLSFVATTTIFAGIRSILDNFLPLAQKPGMAFQGYLNAVLTMVMIASVLIILADSLRRWVKPLKPGLAFTPATSK